MLCDQQHCLSITVDSRCFVSTAWTTSVCRCTLTSSPTATCGVRAGTCGRRRHRRRRRQGVTWRHHCAVRQCRSRMKDVSRQTRASTPTTTSISSSGLHRRLTTSQTSPCLASQLEHSLTHISTYSWTVNNSLCRRSVTQYLLYCTVVAWQRFSLYHACFMLYF